MLKYLLDTNIVIYILKRRPTSVLDAFNKHQNQLCISAITLAELIHGAEKSQRTEQNLQVIDDFISRLDVLSYTPEAAAHFGDIRARLEEEGSIIGVNDLHIAAHARANGLIVVTNNEREFSRVQGLRIENWLAPGGENDSKITT